ncbi:NRDE family protein [Aureispira anguillae]|uniref:NRDE family protein n=1 Tax=Aureispira anguillae TaxID=2864201 RepID=A0A915YBI5_9BACT|nr:NRDE family protein [Aureispira anguillae]BDS10036.1 NRDE family protein [Aureispira anguillae]
MCTLTYIPIEKEAFIWTQNRDESPLRTASGLVQNTTKQWIYPQEPLSGGTWISITQAGRVVSLLNGAFVQNKYVPSARSRGLMLLDFLDYTFLKDFVEHYTFEALEPFTMVVYEHGTLWEFRWDKKQKYLKQLNAQQPYIWSSSTLYPASIKALRQQWFAAYLENYPVRTRTNILNFHHHAGMGDLQNDLIMDRGMVKTVSITSIVKTIEEIEMNYYDLVRKNVAQQKLRL